MSMLACNEPHAYAMTRVQEARMEDRARRKRRNELTLAVVASVRALVAFETKDAREVEHLLLEAEGYIAQRESA